MIDPESHPQDIDHEFKTTTVVTNSVDAIANFTEMLIRAAEQL